MGGICRDASGAQRNGVTWGGLGQEHPEPQSSSFAPGPAAISVISWGLLLIQDLFLLEKSFKKHLTETIT